jgi:hypothetical protein
MVYKKTTFLTITIFFLCFISGTLTTGKIYISTTKTENIIFEPHAFTPYAKASVYSSSTNFEINADGILVYDYGTRYNNLGKYPNPTFIASYGNALYRDYLNGETDCRDLFFKQVDYLIGSSSVDKNGFHYYPYPFDNTHYGAPVGWYSAMTSGRVLGLMVRAHSLSGDEKYLDFAKSVFEKLKKSINNGGMTSYLTDGSAWLEEVSSFGGTSFKILNGHVYALAGLHDYATYTRSITAKKLFDSGVKAVEQSIGSAEPSFNIDAGFISYYCEIAPKKENGCSFAERGGYNLIHISQMLYLFDISKNPIFLECALKFIQYEVEYGEVSASLSINKKSHGPDKMELRFGNEYWSAGKFPVEVQMNMGKIVYLNGLTILGHSKSSTPKDFYVAISLDGVNWQRIASNKDNSVQLKQIDFSYTVEAKYLRITILKSNSKVVALDGLGLIRADQITPIVDFKNFTIGAIKVLDEKTDSKLLIKDEGWIVVPTLKNHKTISISGEFGADTLFSVEMSQDLTTYVPYSGRLDQQANNLHLELPSVYYKYYRISFDKNVYSLSSIKAEYENVQ